MSLDGIDNQIERYTKKINEITEKLKKPNLDQDCKKETRIRIGSCNTRKNKMEDKKK